MDLTINNSIFIDTSFFKGLIDLKDDFHGVSVKVWEQIHKDLNPLVTSNFILDETFTLVRVRCGLNTAIDLRERFLAGTRRIKIARIQINDEAEAWNWFNHQWKDLSFTDCTSFAVMKRLGITKAATFDDHFGKAGFEVVK